MRPKPVIPRAQARRDVAEAVDFYLAEGSERVALGFIDALERTYRDIGRYPATGSLRYAHELNLPGLRSFPLKRFPYQVFYVDRDDHVDVWRVLHGGRDVPNWMTLSQSA